ncbi:MAG TPA: cobalamin-independent methionine synthase II family protein [Chloroflexota bacterium]|nr:cobalamin-independent methionine synthase II family protein [Chloroflexota bacterium]
MRHSLNRIAVVHAGSLPRPAELQRTVEAGDMTAFGERLPAAVAEVVQRQVESGLSEVNDGELSKLSGFSGYARERLRGLEERPYESGHGPAPRDVNARDQRAFPGFFDASRGGMVFRTASRQMFCVGPLEYSGGPSIATDIRNLKAALSVHGAQVEGYLPAIAPGTIEHWMWNEHYASDEELLFAIADAMHEEYQAVTDAGLVLQIDDPDLPDGWQMFPEMSVEDYRRYAAVRVEALNHALRGLPREQIRLHVCWGSGHGPHQNDIPLRDIVDLILRVNVGCYSIEAANPRHEHEWTVWEDVKLPEGKLLMPGVVGHSTDIIEHPDLVAQRLVRYAGLVGREQLVAGTDCGLGPRVGHPEIVWAKLTALSEGARRASSTLWGP